MTELVAALLKVHGSLSFLEDVVGLSVCLVRCRSPMRQPSLLHDFLVQHDSTSVLCFSCNLTLSFLPVSPTYVSSQLALGTLYTHSEVYPWSIHSSMTAHVRATARSCFAALRQIRSVHRSLSRDALVALIRALVVTKLDYCCSAALIGVSGTLLRRLQSVLNAAARIVFSARSSDHITPLLRELHWLKITERIQFRLCVLAYRCFNLLAR